MPLCEESITVFLYWQTVSQVEAPIFWKVPPPSDEKSIGQSEHCWQWRAMLGQHYMHLVMLTFVNPRRAWARGFWYFVLKSVCRRIYYFQRFLSLMCDDDNQSKFVRVSIFILLLWCSSRSRTTHHKVLQGLLFVSRLQSKAPAVYKHVKLRVQRAQLTARILRRMRPHEPTFSLKLVAAITINLFKSLFPTVIYAV